MSWTKFEKILDSVSAFRKSRKKAADYLVVHPELTRRLLGAVPKAQNRKQQQLLWVLEMACREDVEILSDYIEYFLIEICSLQNKAIERCCSKICELIAHTESQKRLSSYQRTKIIEHSFIWLTESQQVAVAVNAMQTLYILKDDKPWLVDELRAIIQEKYPSSSAGFKSRASKILNKLS